MPRPTLDQVRTNEYAVVYMWNFEFGVVPPCLQGYLPSDQKLNILCSTAGLPKATNMPTDIRVRGHRHKQPGIMEYSTTIVINFLETVDNEISEMIWNWREACWASNTGTSWLTNDVVGEIVLTRTDRQENDIWWYILKGTYLEDYDYSSELSDSSPDALKFALTISYDYFTEGSKDRDETTSKGEE